jgi:zinc protease
LSLLSDIARNPALDPAWIERVRRQTLQAIERRQESSWQANWDNLRELLYGDHAYSRVPLGTIESVKRLTREDLQEFHQKTLTPDNAVLSVVGDVDTTGMRQAVEQVLGDWQGTAQLRQPRELDVPVKPTKEVAYRENMHLAQVALGLPGPALDDADRPTFDVIKAILGGLGSRLFVDLRDERSLGYSVGAFSHAGLDGGAFVLYIASSPHKTGELSTYDAVLELSQQRFRHHLELLRTEPVEDEELNFAKRHVIGREQIGLQSNGSQALTIALDVLYGFPPDYSFRYAERIQEVDADDIQRVAQEHFQPEQICTAILRPRKQTAAAEGPAP